MTDEIPIRTLSEMTAADVGSQPIFYPGHASGALPNGSRVRKVRNEVGDTHTVGDQATVLSSMGPNDEGEIFYFVEWDDLPGVPVGIRGNKLAAV